MPAGDIPISLSLPSAANADSSASFQSGDFIVGNKLPSLFWVGVAILGGAVAWRLIRKS